LLLLLLLLFHFWCARMVKFPVAGFAQSVEFLKKLEFAQRFPGLEKVWKMEITSGKMVKSLEATTSALH